MFYVRNFDIDELRGVRGPPYIFCLLLKKTKKAQKHDLYLNQILHHFYLNHFFLRWIIKKLRNGGPQGAPLVFFDEVSIVVLIDFIAILLTPGIFLIQVVNTNNTNMYLIHFYNKNNIKIRFPKSWVFKGSNPLQTFIIDWNGVK